MIIDGRNYQQKETRKYDICILGGGAAGITLTNELRLNGINVAVIESGALKHDEREENLEKVLSEGLEIKKDSRVRQLGGATNAWGGLTTYLDEIDLKKRPWVSYSGWPISYDVLSHYYDLASASYFFPQLKDFVHKNLSTMKQTSSHTFTWKKLEEKIFLAQHEPLKFGEHFADIFNLENIDLYINSNVVNIELDECSNVVDHVTVKTTTHRTFCVKSKLYILALGGIENARLLLLSNKQRPEGLGNENDQVGRYFLNHPKGPFGRIMPLNGKVDLRYYWGFLYKNWMSGFAGIRLSDKAQEERGLLNCYTRFEPLYEWSDNKGVACFLNLYKKHLRSVFAQWMKLGKYEAMSLRVYEETEDDSIENNDSLDRGINMTWAIARNSPALIKYLYYRLRNVEPSRIDAIRCRNHIEMEPNPENRVVLAGEKDIYGNRIPKVRANLSTKDKQSIVELHNLLGQEIKNSGFGVFESDLERYWDRWPINDDSSHHSGTTRMGHVPKSSVVDENCKIHSVHNLYVAGSSLFPTSGHANPTFTIVALAIRLAEHLKDKLKSTQAIAADG